MVNAAQSARKSLKSPRFSIDFPRFSHVFAWILAFSEAQRLGGATERAGDELSQGVVAALRAAAGARPGPSPAKDHGGGSTLRGGAAGGEPRAGAQQKLEYEMSSGYI